MEKGPSWAKTVGIEGMNSRSAYVGNPARLRGRRAKLQNNGLTAIMRKKEPTEGWIGEDDRREK